MKAYDTELIGTGLSFFEEGLPYESRDALDQDQRARYVGFLINTVREVAEAEPAEDFVALPLVLHENFAIADALIDSHYTGSDSLGSGNQLHYFIGEYEGTWLEFGVEEDITQEGNNTLIAWGLRRSGKEKTPPAIIGGLERVEGESVVFNLQPDLKSIRKVGGAALLKAA